MRMSEPVANGNLNNKQRAILRKIHVTIQNLHQTLYTYLVCACDFRTVINNAL